MTNQTKQPTVPEAIALAKEALWVVHHHNKLYYGESHNTVTQTGEALAALESLQVGEPSVSDMELAQRILTALGYATEPSMEPGADERRDRIAEIIASNAAPCARCADLFKSARQLALVMWEADYKTLSPNFQLLDDSAGILTQIDNMYAGLREKLAALESLQVSEPVGDHIEDVRGMVPVEYLLNGSRFKLSFQEVECSNCGHSTSEFVCRPLDQYVSELSGEWVALVNAENDKHLKSDCPRCAELADQLQFQSSLTKELLPYQDEAVQSRAKLAALEAEAEDLIQQLRKEQITIAQQADKLKYTKMAADEEARKVNELTERIKGLTYELSVAREANEGLGKACDARGSERDALAEQLAAAEKDTERLDFLDKLNHALNSHYGTTYGWKLIFSPNIVRLMSGAGGNGRVADIDLNDAEAHGSKSCRLAIDAATAALEAEGK